MNGTRPPLVDQADRDCIRTALDSTLVVEAAAGTGKTTELVARMVNTLAEGRARIGEIVAVTFTEKAAGELKLRLREEIEHARAIREGEARQRLEDALAHLEDAHVSTIHGFCADLLRERPVEADVDPRFEVLLEPVAAQILDGVVDEWLREILEAPPEGVRRVLRRAYRDDDEGEAGPRAALRRAVQSLAEWRDFAAPWRRDPIDRRALLTDALQAIHAFAALSARGSGADNLFADTAPIRRFARLHPGPIPAGAAGEEVLDGLEALLGPLSRDKAFTRCRTGYGSTYAVGVPRAEVRARHADLKALLQQTMATLEADLAACLQRELQPCLERYDAAKQARGALDFTDLLVRVRDLLRDDRAVREDFQARYRRLFVDEFQDTDPIQAEILLLLAADDPAESSWTRVRPVPGKLFIVGDPKQAIYRFRRADVETYWQVKRQLEAVGALSCQLRTCFRSVPSLQRAINHVFAPVMDGDASSAQASYVALEPVRTDVATQPALVALPVPRPYKSRFVSYEAIEASLPDATGAFVHWLVHESGWTVSERAPGGRETRVPIQARHVAILFRRFTSWGEDVTRPYVAALEARHVPHLLVGGRSFHAREEVDALRVALCAIEWPDDELSVHATLRGGFFAFADHLLLAYREAHGGRLWPIGVPEAAGRGERDPADDEAIEDALRLLRDLHRHRNRVPVQDTVQALLRATRAHAALALRPGGEQALANVLHVVELARQYEATDGASFRGFVQRFLDETHTEAAESPILEEGTDGVRLMTVHKAKGLEFPVVILADPTCRLASDRPSRALVAARGLCAQVLAGCTPLELLELRDEEIARDRAEGHRLAYVAATRARDLLVVPGVGDEPYPNAKQGEKWIGVMNAALYPDRPWPAPEAAVGCPPFDRDTVLERPDEEAAAYATPIRPGRYTLGDASAPFDVTWWDPAVLGLGVELSFGERQRLLIEKSAPASRVQEGLEEVARWTQLHEARLASGAVPHLRVQRVTDAAREAVVAADDVRVERVDGAARRAGGRAFGALVHEVLAEVALEATEQAVAAHVAFKARVLDATDVDQAAVVAAIRGTLQHPLLRAAALAEARGQCRREAPVTLRLQDGTWIEGQLDLAFEDADGWTVVDFKTDAELDEVSLDAYRRQVALYARALTTATGRPAAGVLLRV
ncbi:ATP-dependent DNA helicase [Luteitalea sp. TBR-22]|uniref:UvrD-helicase domain-containing protein n=1 Tax=Luteitalea sp. TBR-22 TaxID=2802971 RepID=UPI001AFA6DC0|nr:UvrD-helicase domain-containing protein [Luteitalea sp. TBR-22]BCS35357.1 ATP-dependent DNA helicase [Luteitalea sp. TBR-22]